MYKKIHQNSYIFDKFSELKSQSNEKIIWSSSDSSDIENNSFNRTCVYRNIKTRKRKRKVIVLKNSSKLDVTVEDANGNDTIRKSPILDRSQRIKFPKTTRVGIRDDKNQLCRAESPILSSPRINYKNKIFVDNANSSGNSSTSFKNTHRCKSPILGIRAKNTLTDKYKFSTDHDNTIDDGAKSPILCLNKSKVDLNKGLNQKTVKPNHFRHILAEILKEGLDKGSEPIKGQNINKINDILNSQKSQYSISESQSEESVNKLSIDIDSGSSSQASQTISKTNADASIKFSIKDLNDLKLKRKYQKNGLAYRLQNLLKRRNSNFLLWQNESYLSKNSSFKKPKEEFLAFRIQQIYIKYGVCLLQTVNVNDDSYLIVLNASDFDNGLKKDMILKLYKPYDLLDWKLDGMKIILNSLKYECVNVDMLDS